MEKFNTINVSSCPTPMKLEKHKTKTSEEILKNQSLYRGLVSELQYLTNTRPDISFDLDQLSQHFSSSTTLHREAAKHALRYLKGTVDLELHIKPFVDLTLNSYSDANWANNTSDRRFVGGYCVFLGGSLVAWSRNKGWYQGLVLSLSIDHWLL